MSSKRNSTSKVGGWGTRKNGFKFREHEVQGPGVSGKWPTKLEGWEGQLVKGHFGSASTEGSGAGTEGKGTLTSVVIDTVGLNERDGDGLAQRVVVLLQLCLPQDGVPILAEVLLGPVASRELPGAILLAKHRHPVQAIVADVVAGDVGQAGRHHPHAAALIGWDSERSWSPTLSKG